MNLKKVRGLKYPDEYFTKFFFKNGLFEKSLKVLEFGCGNGSNLQLAYSFDSEVVGVDFDAKQIENANYNFSLHNSSLEYKFFHTDINSFVEKYKNTQADVLLLPSVVYYVSQEDFILFLKNLKKSGHIKNSIPFFIRIRTPKDFRYGLGERVAKSSYKMPSPSITGEDSATITFYTESEIVNILKEHLALREYKVFHLDNQNEHSGEVILNSDIVIWGTVN